MARTIDACLRPWRAILQTLHASDNPAVARKRGVGVIEPIADLASKAAPATWESGCGGTERHLPRAPTAPTSDGSSRQAALQRIVDRDMMLALLALPDTSVPPP